MEKKGKFSEEGKDALLIPMAQLIQICQHEEDKDTIEFAFIEHALLLLRKVVWLNNDYYKFNFGEKKKER